VIKIQSTTERIESKGGLLLAGKIAIAAGLLEIKSSAQKKAGEIITSIFALMVEGKSNFESMGEKRSSLFFKEALGLSFVFAKETIRIYLEKIAQGSKDVIEQLHESTLKIIKEVKLTGYWIGKNIYIPVDIDTSVLDNSKTNKEGVSRTYQGVDGYHPIFAYIGKVGYMLYCELREGSQHCQKGTVEFITRVIEQLGKLKTRACYLFRLDAGNDAVETIKTIIEAGHKCIIKRNKRKESDERWLKRAKKHGKQTNPRKGKKVWIGKIKIHPETMDCKISKAIYIVFEVTERKIDAQGNKYLIPDIEVHSWWTNLDCRAEKVIKLYHAHATSEQFHSELKHDLGVERLPSGKFAVNQILLAIAMNAFNTLRYLGQLSVSEEKKERDVTYERKRLGTVIREIICIAGKLVQHGRSLIFKIYEKNPMLPLFLRLNAALDFA